MNPAADPLAARKRWFEIFPEGGVEFLIITRVGIAGVLLALLVIKESQRSLVWLLLGGLLWIDHAVVLGWLLPMAGDVCGRAGEPADRGRGLRGLGGTLLLACLPAAAALAIVLPWTDLLRLFPALAAHREMIGRVGAGLGAVVFVAAAAACRSRLEALGLKGGLWRLLIHVPGLHWPAVHRYARLLNGRMRGLNPPAGSASEDGGTGAVLTASDIVWALCMLPWVVQGCLAAFRGWPQGFPGMLLPLAGTLMAVVFAVVQLAALERVQRVYLGWLRRQ